MESSTVRYWAIILIGLWYWNSKCLGVAPRIDNVDGTYHHAHTKGNQTYIYRVGVANSVTSLNWTPLFEWYVIRCGSNTGYQKDKCIKETEVRAPNILTIIRSTMNIIYLFILGGGAIWPLNGHKKEFHTSSKNYEKSGHDINLDLLSISC